MNIRTLKEEDIKNVAPLVLSLYKKWDYIDPIEKIDTTWFLSDKQYDYLKNILLDKNKLFIVAEENNILVGYLLAEIEQRKPFLQNVGYIAELYSKLEFRGKG